MCPERGGWLVGIFSIVEFIVDNNAKPAYAVNSWGLVFPHLA
jgi:hypothetical protein